MSLARLAALYLKKTYQNYRTALYPGPFNDLSVCPCEECGHERFGDMGREDQSRP